MAISTSREADRVIPCPNPPVFTDHRSKIHGPYSGRQALHEVSAALSGNPRPWSAFLQSPHAHGSLPGCESPCASLCSPLHHRPLLKAPDHRPLRKARWQRGLPGPCPLASSCPLTSSSLCVCVEPGLSSVLLLLKRIPNTRLFKITEILSSHSHSSQKFEISITGPNLRCRSSGLHTPPEPLENLFLPPGVPCTPRLVPVPLQSSRVLGR